MIVITGSSGIGKSELVPLVRALVPDVFDVHDFDELLTEDVAGDVRRLDEWRRATMREWLSRAALAEQDGRLMVLFGLIYPDELSDMGGTHHRVLLLDCSDDEIRERLLGKRFSSVEKVESLRRATGLTPELFIAHNVGTMRTLRAQAEKYGAHIIDTTDDDPEQTAAAIAGWVKG